MGKGDIGRDSFEPGTRYTGVRRQQGRVQTDADRNEAKRAQGAGAVPAAVGARLKRWGRIYLDVWKRRLGVLEDAKLGEPALGGRAKEKEKEKDSDERTREDQD